MSLRFCLWQAKFVVCKNNNDNGNDVHLVKFILFYFSLLLLPICRNKDKCNDDDDDVNNNKILINIIA